MSFKIAGILMAGEFIVKPGTVLGPREISDYELVFFPEGTSTQYSVNCDKYALIAPSVICTRPEETHTYVFDPYRPTRHLFVHFSMASLPDSNIGDPYDIPSTVFALTTPSVIPHLFRHLLLLLYEQPVDYQLRCEQLLITIITEIIGMGKKGEFNKKSKPLPIKIVQALKFIECNMQKKITVSDVASAVGWSTEHLSRNISTIIGMSPQKVIRFLRLKRACELLCHSELTIGEIAHTVGFEDENYFSRVFKNEKNITASEFRNLYSDPRFLYVVQQDDYLSLYPLNHYFTFNDSKSP